ncbi:hypothetical protein [Yoonia sp. BS5-3]|uniref:Ribosome modulation factor n=1 Tax=Yoonia phaeophyticola TaxID=3137369 RepID=A0ABZ2V0H6_9RHOB
MRQKRTQKYCADPAAIAAMKRDGLGWGHDLECGCFEAPATPQRRSHGRIWNKWKMGG